MCHAFPNLNPSVAHTHHVDADPDQDFCLSLTDPDPDPTFLFDAYTDPDSSFQIKAQNLEKVLKYRLIFYTFWLEICKLMRIRIRCHFDADPDPIPYF